MYSGESLYCFELKQQRRLDHEIDTISDLDVDALVTQSNGLLLFERHATQSELVSQTLLIGRFQQPRSKLAMDLDTRPDRNLRPIPIKSAPHARGSVHHATEFPS